MINTDSPIGVPINKLLEIGKHTYGHEHISLFYLVSNLKIGAFCAIAEVGVG